MYPVHNVALDCQGPKVGSRSDLPEAPVQKRNSAHFGSTRRRTQYQTLNEYRLSHIVPERGPPMATAVMEACIKANVK